MADIPKYKVLIEGIKIPVQTIIRTQIEGEASDVILYLWPTNQGTQILRGSFITIFRWEERSETLEKTYGQPLKDSDVTGVWELFWDGYLDRKPSISRKESRSLVLYCKQWSFRMNSMYMRAFNLSMFDFSYNQDRAFMGINLVPNKFFDITGADVQSNIAAIEQKLISTTGGIGAGLISMIQEASNWDELYARVEAVANIYNRFNYAENATINEILKRENIANIISGQVLRMSPSTTLMSLVNQIMYQTLYTFMSVPSPYIIADKTKINQFIYKPQLFFAVPIISNVIFPSAVDQMEPIGTRVDQPTRVVVESKTNIVGKFTSQILNRKEYFPQKISSMCENYKADSEVDYYDKFTDEEFLEERLVPGQINMPFPDGLMHLVENDPEETIARIYGRYMYAIERNVSEPIRVQMKFDPYLICGLSAVIFDDQFGYILGRLRTIQDTIDLVNQTSKTQIEFVNVRIVPGIENGEAKDVEEEDFQIEDYADLFDGNNDYAMFDNKFNNANIGEEFYEVLFGVKAVNNHNSSESNKSISDAMKTLYENYSAAGESLEEFMVSIKYRPVVTEGQYMSFIEATPTGNGSLGIFDENDGYEALYDVRTKGRTGTAPDTTKARPFMKERQDIIIQYIKDIEDAHFAKIA